MGRMRWRFNLPRRSDHLFMDDWKTHQHTNEQYYAWGGSAGGDVHYTWGALLCLIAMEQFINQNPWNGLRFGALQPSESGTLRNIDWDNHNYDIEVGPQLTSVKEGWRTSLQCGCRWRDRSRLQTGVKQLFVLVEDLAISQPHDT